MKKKHSIGIFVFFLGFLITNSLFAFDFQINQAKIRIKLPPGWSDGGVIKVDNKDKEPVNIRVYVSDWVYNNQDGSKDFMPANTHPRSCAEWIKFYPADFTIPGRGSKDVNYVVGVPPDAVGGYYAVLFFEVGSGTVWDETKGVMIKVFNRLGSLFYVEADGTIKREAKVSDLRIKESAGNIETEAIFENVGNVDITAKGTFDIIDEQGFVLTRGSFNDIYTMPKDKAKLYAKSLSTGFSQGKHDLILTFDLEGTLLVKEYNIYVSNTGKIVDVKEIE